MPDRLGDMIAKAARHSIVGRDREVRAFKSLLRSQPPTGAVLHVFGPGGIGKSTLLALFAEVADHYGWVVIAVDAKNLDPTPAGVVQGMCAAADVEDFDELDALLWDRPSVVMIDSYESLGSLDSWLRDHLIPLLPSSTRLVLSGRARPSLRWDTIRGVKGMHSTMQLRNLERNAAREMLRRRGVPDSEHGEVLEFTHGHPLALSLVAELYREEPTTHFRASHSPRVVHQLVESLVDAVAEPERRTAIEFAALVRTTDESLIAEVIDGADAHELFAWLAQLSFMESHPRGVAPHDLAREAIAADLKWRNPKTFVELHHKARAQYRHRLEALPSDQATTLMDYVYLHRDSPFVRPFMDFTGEGGPHLDALHPEDGAAVVRMVAEHEGSESADRVAKWIGIDPSYITVVRSSTNVLSGFLLQIPLHEVDEEAAAFDATTSRAIAAIRPRLRSGEAAVLFRAWMDAHSHQSISPVQSRIFIEMVHRYLATPRLAQTYLTCADPTFWEPLFVYADMPRHRELEVDGHGVFGHDWRSRPPVAWLDLLAGRETTEDPVFATDDSPLELVVLSEVDFRNAVSDALRNYGRPQALRGSPLLRSSLIVRRPGQHEPEETLRRLLRESVDLLRDQDGTANLYPAMYHGFLNPAPTHESAARLAHVSYSTFRRYTAAGRSLVADRLWRLETTDG